MVVVDLLAAGVRIEAKVRLWCWCWLLLFPSAEGSGPRLEMMLHVGDRFEGEEVSRRDVGDVGLGGKRLDSSSRPVRI